MAAKFEYYLQRTPAPLTPNLATTAAADRPIDTPPLKSEKHPLALFGKTRRRNKSVAAVIHPSLLVLATELFTPESEDLQSSSSN